MGDLMKIRPKTFKLLKELLLVHKSMNKFYMFSDGFKVEVSEYRNLDFGQKIDLQAQHGAFVRYDATRLKGNVAIVDDDGEFVYE